MIDKECKHVPKPLIIESTWEEDKVEVVVECKYCDGAGTAKARLVYEDDIEWMEPVQPVTHKVTKEVPRP